MVVLTRTSVMSGECSERAGMSDGSESKRWDYPASPKASGMDNGMSAANSARDPCLWTAGIYRRAALLAVGVAPLGHNAIRA